MQVFHGTQACFGPRGLPWQDVGLQRDSALLPLSCDCFESLILDAPSMLVGSSTVLWSIDT